MMRETALDVILATTLSWRGRELFAGEIYIGQVGRIVPEGWRDFLEYQIPADARDLRDLVDRHRAHHERHDAKPWRAYLMSSEDGEEVSFHATEAEARDALLTAARKAMED